jgi:sugar phosphate isomerase/epimerase
MTKKIGLQLFSLRSYLDDGIEAMLERVKKAGFTHVEPYKLYDYSAEEFKRMIDNAGLQVESAHIGFGLMKDTPEQVVEDALAMGLKYAICPHAKLETVEDIKESAEVLNRMQDKLLEHNIHVGYHNHSQEFLRLEDKYIEDILFEHFAFPEMLLQIDTCWIRYAGVDPIAYMEGKAKRLAPVHFKDLGASFEYGERHSLDVNLGEGIVDFPGILQMMKAQDILDRGIVVEQEAFDQEPYGILAKTVEYVQSIWPEQ